MGEANKRDLLNCLSMQKAFSMEVFELKFEKNATNYGDRNDKREAYTREYEAIQEKFLHLESKFKDLFSGKVVNEKVEMDENKENRKNNEENEDNEENEENEENYGTDDDEIAENYEHSDDDDQNDEKDEEDDEEKEEKKDEKKEDGMLEG